MIIIQSYYDFIKYNYSLDEFKLARDFKRPGTNNANPRAVR